jgi:hypothetical protein
MYALYFFMFGVLMAFGHIVFLHTPVIEAFLVSLIFSDIGLTGFFAFYGHFFRSDEVAAKIGWATGNPFQLEIAFTNLALGVVGILSYWFHGGFWLATILASGIFTAGAGYVHIMDTRKTDNRHVYNGGAVLYADILKPVILLGLYLAYVFA